MENMNFYDQLRKCPDTATKKINGGRLSGMTDIRPQWRTERMTELFGPCGIGWYYEETRREYKEYDNQIAVFVDINLYYRFAKIDPVTERQIGWEWSKPIHGTGGSMFVAKENKGPFVSDEAVKMALTDALSVSMKAIGMAADIYMGMPATGTKYDKQSEQPEPKKLEFLNQSHEKYQQYIDALKSGGKNRKGERITTEMICKGYDVSPEAKKAFQEAENEFLNSNK